MTLYKFARYGLLILTGWGLLNGTLLSLQHIQQGEVCPMFGPIPACFIVFLGYLLMFIAAIFIADRPKGKLFIIGWIPVFLLAFSGVAIEITGTKICPAGAYGIPKCFYSFAVTVLTLLLFIFIRRQKISDE